MAEVASLFRLRSWYFSVFWRYRNPLNTRVCLGWVGATRVPLLYGTPTDAAPQCLGCASFHGVRSACGRGSFVELLPVPLQPTVSVGLEYFPFLHSFVFRDRLRGSHFALLACVSLPATGRIQRRVVLPRAPNPRAVHDVMSWSNKARQFSSADSQENIFCVCFADR